jgi:hypothetical protein
MPSPPLVPNTLVTGDTNYIAELNANFASLAAAITVVQGQLNNLPAVQSIQLFLQAVLGSTNTILGATGLESTIDGPIVTIAAGFIWIAQSATVLQLIAATSQDMTTFNPGTWYWVIDSAGNAGVFSSSTAGAVALYSFVWDGTTVSAMTLLVARAGLEAM